MSSANDTFITDTHRHYKAQPWKNTTQRNRYAQFNNTLAAADERLSLLRGFGLLEQAVLQSSPSQISHSVATLGS